MKKTVLTLCTLTMFATVNASELKGVAADSRIKGTEELRYVDESSIPNFIKFNPASQPEVNMLEGWLKTNARLNSDCSFKLLNSEKDQLGYVHYRYQQTYMGYPVLHTMFIAHTLNGKLISANGFLSDRLPKSISVSLSEQAALQNAMTEINATIYKWQMPQEEAFLKREQNNPSATFFPVGELVLASNAQQIKSGYQLAWQFDVYAHEPMGRYFIYVDAKTGAIIEKIDRIHEGNANATAVTAYAGNQAIITDSTAATNFRLRETGRGLGIETYNMLKGTNYGAAVDFTDTDNYWNNVNANKDQYATDAHLATEKTYDYYYQTYGRNSINNAGLKLLSYVHYSTNYVNAFWDGTRMTYGDGNATYNPLTSLDIGGHEVTHGLTSYTANLNYSYQSGALNESFSDIFGTTIENYAAPAFFDWLIGEDIGGAFRSHSNPNAYGDPDTYLGTNWYTGTGDNGGVHTNSGVQNFWYYLLTVGGSGTNDIGNAYNVTGIGMTKAAAIAYRNLTVYLTPTSQYADARFYAIQAATDLYGSCSPEVIATNNAWYAVGVGSGQIGTAATVSANGPTTFCNGNTVLLTANAASGTTYQWNLNGSPISGATNANYSAGQTGNYSCSTVTCGASFTSSATAVTVNSIAATISPSGTVDLCSGGSATLNANTSTGYGYQWNLNGAPISGATNSSYSASSTGNYSVTYIAQTLAGQTQTNNTTSTIVDNTCTNAANTSITISGFAGNINPSGITVTVNLTHTYDGDIDVVLVAPNGDVLGLSNGAGGAGDNYVNTVFSDAGTTTLASGTAPFTGTFKPWATTWTSCIPVTKTSFASLGNGSINPNGTWTLRVYDRYAQDVGTLNNWTLNIPSYTVPSPNCGPATSPVTTVNIGTLSVNAGTYNPICNNASPIALSGSPSGGTFSGTGVSSNFFDPAGLASGSYIITYNYSNGNCSGSATTNIVVNALPSVDAGTYSPVCENSGNVTLNGTPAGGVFIGAGVAGNIFNPSFSNGTFPISYTYTDGNGCTATSYTSITVNPLPVVNAGSYNSVCQNASVITLAGTPAGGTFTGTGVTGNSFNPNIGAGAYTINYEYIDGNGCTGNANTTINVNALPSVNAGTYSDVCSNAASVSLSGTPAGGTFSGTGVSGNLFNPAGLSGNYTLTYTYTDGNSCTNSNTASINVSTAPTAVISPSGIINTCNGSVLLSANTGAGLSYIWMLNGTPIPSSNNPTYTATSTGSYTVYVYDIKCNTTSVPVQVNLGVGTPTITASGATAICEGTAVTLNATPGATSYQWYKNNTIQAGATSSSYTISSAGNYFCNITAASCSGNSNVIPVTVINNPAPVVTFTTPLTFCAPGYVVLTSNTYAGVTYQWQKNSVDIAGATNQTYTATSTGKYRVKLTANGCTKQGQDLQVSVNALSVTAAINANGPTSFCSGGSVTLSVNNSIPGYNYQWKNNGVDISGANGTSYIATGTGTYTCFITASCGSATSNSISVSTSGIAAVVSPSGTVTICNGAVAALSANTGTGYNHQWLLNGNPISGATNASYNATAAGSYSVDITSPCGNASSATTVVNVAPLTSSSSPVLTTVCEGQAGTFSANTGYNYTYQWYRNGALLSGATNSTYATSQAANYTVIITQGGVCSATSNQSTLVVINNPKPTITPGGPTTFCAGSSVVLTANTFAGVVYQWQKNSANITGATNQSYTANTTGQYRVVQTANGCSKIATPVQVTVSCRSASGEAISEEVKVVPNPFADEFTVYGLQFSAGDRIEMMDMLGKVVLYQTINTATSNLQLQTLNLPSGVYFLQVSTPTEKKTIKVVKQK